MVFWTIPCTVIDYNSYSKFFLPFHPGYGFPWAKDSLPPHWRWAWPHDLQWQVECGLEWVCHCQVQPLTMRVSFHSPPCFTANIYKKSITYMALRLQPGSGNESLTLKKTQTQVQPSSPEPQLIQNCTGRNKCCYKALKLWVCLLCSIIIAKPEYPFLDVCIISYFSQNSSVNG